MLTKAVPSAAIVQNRHKVTYGTRRSTPKAGADAALRLGPEEAPNPVTDDDPSAGVELDPNNPPEDAPNAGAADPAHAGMCHDPSRWLPAVSWPYAVDHQDAYLQS